MKRFGTNTTAMPSGPVGKAFDEVSASFERFCLAAGVETLSAMLEKDAEEVCGPRHARGGGRRGHRWGRTRGKIGFHGGKVELERPRVRDFDGQELPLPSWERASEEDWLGRWAMNLMLIDIMVVQIDGIHIAEDIVLVAAIGIDGEGAKHPLGLIEGASEHSAVVQALIDNLIERGLDPAVPRLFIIDGSKALSKAIRRSFGRHTPIQRCQIHKARNIMERLPEPLHASVRRVLHQAWELDDADKAEKLIRNLAQRLERDAPGVSTSILEGLDEILTVTRLGLPAELRRSLACTNIMENVMGTVRKVCRNVKRWQSTSMALRWTAAAMNEASKGFRKLKAHKQLPILRSALIAHHEKTSNNGILANEVKAA